MPLSRRRVIYLAVSVGGAAIIVAATGGSLYLSENTNESGTVPTSKKITTITSTQKINQKSYPKNSYIDEGKSLVSVVQGTGKKEDVPEMVRRSVNLLGGLEKIDVKGKRVLVKPNMNSNNAHPASTNPLVVGTIVEMLLEAGATKVMVGDSSNINNKTSDVMRDQGIKKAVEDAGGEVMFLEDEEFITVQIPGGKWLTETQISRPVYEAERLIDLPVIKSHNVTNYTMSMKNFVGTIHKDSRFDPEWKPTTKVFHSCGNPAEAAAELNILVNPDLVVMDGTRSLVSYGEGDDAGEVRDTNMIIASGDRIANDIVGLSIIKSYGIWPNVVDKEVWDQPTIKRALELGLGRNKEEIKILGESLPRKEKFYEMMQTIHNLTGIPRA
jgi:uncharacterized protein (DUF362 family)|tara:strand:+ start:398 stop:1549 length:1152 start_codon:yes stop_codon:yes gene_type:complete